MEEKRGKESGINFQGCEVILAEPCDDESLGVLVSMEEEGVTKGVPKYQEFYGLKWKLYWIHAVKWEKDELKISLEWIIIFSWWVMKKLFFFQKIILISTCEFLDVFNK